MIVLTLLLASAEAQVPDDEYLRGKEFSAAFWQLTIVSRMGFEDLPPTHGYDFTGRKSCVREGIKRMQESLKVASEKWANIPMGFVCELTLRED
jgi:hypothetical protein